MSPLLTGLVLRPWAGVVHGPVTMTYDGQRTIEQGVITDAAAQQVALSGTAPLLGGSVKQNQAFVYAGSPRMD